MTINGKITILEKNPDAEKNQPGLKRAAKISALNSGGTNKYELLTKKLLKPLIEDREIQQFKKNYTKILVSDPIPGNLRDIKIAYEVKEAELA